MIGSLLYLCASRPDIMLSVCMCARFQANPKECTKPKERPRSHHFLRDHEAKGYIALSHVSTDKQLADIFTKPLDESRFCSLRNELNILDSRCVV
jgi:hypothetical protein